MAHFAKTLVLMSLFVLSSCNQGVSSRFRAGQCIEENYSNYASYFKKAGPVYRIDSQKTVTFQVSVWHNNSWFYQGEKSKNYFKARSTLLYTKTSCPNSKGRTKASIEDKLKGIDL